MKTVVTVRDILAQPLLEDSKVLAGMEGLDNEVRSVTVAEIPDIARWLNGHDFVHCVGRFLSSANPDHLDDEQMTAWARSLYEGGASCLAFKTKRYLDEVPQALINLGNELGFPIIELPEGNTQGAVTECVFKAIIAAYEASARRSQQAFMDLCSIMVGPHRMGEVAKRLADYLCNPILIEDESFHFLAASDVKDSQEARVLAKRREPYCLEGLRKEMMNNINDTGYQNNLNSNYWEFDIDDVHQLTIPVTGQQEILGYVSVLETRSALTDDDRALLRTCLGAVALDMGQRAMMQTAVLRARGDFFDALIATPFDEISCQRLAELVGIDLTHERCAVIISVQQQGMRASFHQASDYYGRVIGQLLRRAADYLASNSDAGSTILCAYESGMAIFFDTDQRNIDVKDITNRLLKEMNDIYPDVQVDAGIGSNGHSLLGYRRSSLEAFEALRCMTEFDIDEPVMCYANLGRYALLSSMVRDIEGAQSFCRMTLGPLIDKDRQDGTELLKTLHAYLESNGGVSRAAELLCVHPNTVKYRMKQIRDLLPGRLDTFEDRSIVWQALEMFEYLKRSGNL